MIAPAKVPDFTYLAGLDCARYFQLRYEERLGPRKVSRGPLQAGSAIHEALAVLYLGDAWDADAAVVAALASWGDDPLFPPKGSRYPFLTRGHLEAVTRNYAARRSPTEFEVARDATRRLVEAPLVETLPLSGIVAGGKPDLAVRVGGDLYVVDHKATTGYVSPKWAEKWAFSHQLRLYTILLGVLTGEKVVGAFINGIHMGSMGADDAAKWKTRTSMFSGLFGPYHFSPSQLAETEQWVASRLREIERRRADADWPQRGDMARCSWCEFRDPCSRGDPVRTALLRRDYVQRDITGVLASGADSGDSSEAEA